MHFLRAEIALFQLRNLAGAGLREVWRWHPSAGGVGNRTEQVYLLTGASPDHFSGHPSWAPSEHLSGINGARSPNQPTICCSRRSKRAVLPPQQGGIVIICGDDEMQNTHRAGHRSCTPNLCYHVFFCVSTTI